MLNKYLLRLRKNNGFCGPIVGIAFISFMLVFFIFYFLNTFAITKKIKTPDGKYKLSFLEFSTNTDKFDKAELLPMIVILHGYGDSAKNAMRGFRTELFNKLQSKARVIVPCAFLEHKKSWFQFDDPENGIDVYAPIVAKTIEELAKKYPTRGKPIFVGFSQGAYMTYYIGVNHPEVASAVFSISGYLYQKFIPKKLSMSVDEYPLFFGFNNTGDPLTSFSSARATIASLKKLSLKVLLKSEATNSHWPSYEMWKDVAKKIDLVIARGKDDAIFS